jgi:hypothetical protein
MMCDTIPSKLNQPKECMRFAICIMNILNWYAWILRELDNILLLLYATVFRPKYFEAIDLAMASVTERFDQPGYRVLQNVEDLLIKAAQPLKTEYTWGLGFVCDFYGNDINRDIIEVQLQLLCSHFDKSENSTFTLPDVLKFVSKQLVLKRALFSEVVVLLKILLVMPATNATSGSTFSALRRIKNR